MTLMTLVPAYGRDYKNEEAVMTDWNDNEDFQISDISSRWNGSYVNKEQVKKGDTVFIRYKKLTKVCAIKVE